MSHHNRSIFQKLSGPQLGILIAGALLVLLIGTDQYLQSRRPAYVPTDLDRLVMLAKSHPDQRVRKDLIEAMGSGKVALATTNLGSSANGTFSVLGGKPTITLDATLLVAAANRSGQEIAYAVLYHEYEHYLQWLLMPAVRELHAAYASDKTLTPFQCGLKVSNESEAYAKTCDAAHRYKWNAAIRSECDGVGISLRAKRFADRITDLPECLATWSSMVRQDIQTPILVTPEKPEPLEEHSEGGVQ